MVDTVEQALYIRIKVAHPYWSDESVKKEIAKLQSNELAKDIQELFRRVNERGIKNDAVG